MSNSKHNQQRRSFLIGSAGGLAAASLGLIPGVSSQAATPEPWALRADIVVVGSGAAALTAAVVAQAQGDSVLVLEKGPISGGTTRKSGGVFWIPNHYALREQGIKDTKEDCLQYLCRMAYPEKYYPEAPNLGLDQDAYRLLEAFYDHGSPMVDLLRELKALNIAPFRMWDLDRLEPDYQGHLPEDKVPAGRSLGVLKADGGLGSGTDFIDQLEAYLAAKDVTIMTDHRVTSLVQNDAGEVVGVRVDNDGTPLSIAAAKAVIFGSGGYPHNLDYVRLHQSTFLYGSCATPYATGDFIGMAGRLGARLGNLQSAWRSQALIEESIENRSLARCVDMPPGDSMFMVNKYGQRVVNEKRNYNDRSEIHLVFDPNNGEFPNQLLFIIYDQRTAELYGGSHPLPTVPDGAKYVIVGKTLDELAENISARVDQLRPHTGTVRLSEQFTVNLRQTFEKFNGYAANGVDPDFSRGAAEYDKAWATFFQPPRKDTRWPVASGAPNPAMSPLLPDGPYYAMIVGAGALDTNGGPVIDALARVIDSDGKPIPGLYGAGNCIASPTRNAYMGAGGTIGPAMAFGYIAALNATQQKRREV